VRPDEFLSYQVILVVMGALKDLLLSLVDVIYPNRSSDTTAGSGVSNQLPVRLYSKAERERERDENGGIAYKPPNQNTPTNWTLRRVGIFKVRIMGRGKHSTITSKTILMPATAREKAAKS